MGICGSIAAYKAAMLVRLLIKSGAEVQVIMTEAAKTFIAPLTLATLSGKPVLTSFVSDVQSGTWNNHVALGLWADALVVAPASANTLARMAIGLSDDLLTVTYLSARCPVWVAPAMDLDMYQHMTTQRNLEQLRSAGNFIIDAEQGELASGLYGAGRMAEPETIVAHLNHYFQHDKLLQGKKVLITAGPTQEAIDPVRFISNASSGKMGYALAEAMADYGAEIQLISGPVFLKPQHPGIHVTHVVNAKEMLEASQKHFSGSDIAIFAAAVSDYTPKTKYDQKLKKTTSELTLVLEKNPDIASILAGKKRSDQFVAGFALETQHELDHAQQKLKAKNLDMIVLNSLNDQGAGFGYDTNKVRLLFRDNTEVREFALKDKQAVAYDIVHAIIEKTHV